MVSNTTYIVSKDLLFDYFNRISMLLDRYRCYDESLRRNLWRPVFVGTDINTITRVAITIMGTELMG